MDLEEAPVATDGGLPGVRAPSLPLSLPAGRVNGSLGAGRGRVNGSQVAPRSGSTNGRSVGKRRPRGGRRPRGLPARALALVLAAAFVLPSLLLLAVAGHPARFTADGDFSEWQDVPALPDTDASATTGPDLKAVRLALRERILFVEAEAALPFLASAGPSAVRIFVDADGKRQTGFDLGDLGADVMLETVAEGPGRVASALFAFSPARAPDDWHGWERVGPAVVAFEGARLEAALPGLFSERASVEVALSVPGAEDLLDPPASLQGALLVAQATGGAQVLGEGAQGAELVRLSVSATGADARVDSFEFVPSGPADFTALQGARLVLADGRSVDASSLSPQALRFQLEPPLDVLAGAPSQVSLLGDLARGRSSAALAGLAFGARLSGVGHLPAEQLLVVRPRELAPSAYLTFVAAAPVVDGAFGEWRLAGAAADPTDLSALPGEDLIGVAAMTSGDAGAFFAEARGAILEGARLGEMPQLVELPTETGPSPGPAGAALPPAPRNEPAPLSADDRLLVYLDADSDPSTGFRPALDVPIGAEFVVEVAGRFSWAARGQLLEFAGSSPFESRWTVRGPLKAAAEGSALEGEIPGVVFQATGAARVFFQTVAWSGRTGDLSDALEDASLPAENPENLLQFRSVTFDPLGGPPPIRQGLTLAAPDGHWVVQLKAPPTSPVLGALESAGATLFGYVHSNAYLAAMDESQAAVVRSMPEVRWVGVYEPAFKFPVDPAAWGPGPLTLLALLFTRPRDLESQVEGVGGTVLSATEASLRVRINGSALEAFGRIPSVQYVDLENQRVPLNDVGRALQGVNLTFFRHGLNGSKIVVGISDTGIDFTHPAFDDTGTSSSGPHFDGRIVAYFRYGAAYGDSDGHGTHTAGSVAGDGDLSNTTNTTTPADTYQFRGMAPAASLAVMEIIGASPPSDDKVYADQESAGATVSSNSWGYVNSQQHGITDYDSAAYLADQSVIDSNTSKSGLQPLTIVFAAGNDGTLGADSVGTPGTAKNIITVGASETNRGYDTYADNSSSIAVFSSLGPTDDGRIKPDIVAVGTYVLSTQSRTSGCTCTFGGWDQSWTGANYAFEGGTSQATPQVAGIVALIQQNINETLGRIPSPALVKAAVINGAQDLGYGYEFTGGSSGPMKQGWGRVNVSRSIDGPPNGTILLFDEGPVVATGVVSLRRFNVANSSTPLKATLVWTDQPGNPQDTKTLAELVNDLDLTVRAPNGTVYHGNRFQGSWSRANNTTFDRLNNIENVFVQAPGVGTWTLEVSGYSVKSASQRFALAVSGNLTEKAPPSVADVHAVPGAPANAKFGWNVSTVGSINGDAFADLVVGAPGASGGSGALYIFFGGAGKSLSSLNVSLADVTINGTGGEAFGSALDTSGDFSGDGTNDLIVGAPSGGKAYLYYGAASWSSPSPAVTFIGLPSDRFGAAVLLAPIDNRSGAEAVVGAPLNTSAKGTAYVFGGTPPAATWNISAANATFQGATNASRLGSALSGGDADGDGKADLAVGAPGASLVRLAKGGGALSALTFNTTVSGIPGTAFGAAVTLSGDLNDDGKADLLVGAPLANDSAGAAYVFFGTSPLVDEQVTRYYFFDDMEGDATKWQEMSGSANGSTPWSLSSTVFYGPAPAGHSWQDSSGVYNASVDASIAFIAGVNLSGALSPILTFVYRADLEATASNFDGFLVKVSVNGGSTWTQVNANNSQGNYEAQGNNPGGTTSDTPISGLWAFTYDRFVWRQVTFNLSSLSGNSSVKVRFQFASDSSGNGDGIYIDNIAVREASPSSPDLALYGESAGDRFGTSVASMGDANGDGTADFAVGAPYASPGGLSAAGQAFLFTGSPTLNGTNTSSGATEVLSGTSAGANLGWSLGPLSGFNSSTSTFLFAGTPGASSGAGGALVGNATSPIPEFGSLAVPGGLVGLAALALRRRRRGAV